MNLTLKNNYESTKIKNNFIKVVLLTTFFINLSNEATKSSNRNRGRSRIKKF
jgi:hypothetical protein